MGVPFWLVDDALGSGVDTRIGTGIEPMPQLGIQIVEVAEGAGKEEVLTNVVMVAQPCPWFWPDKGGTPSAESHSAGQYR